MKTLFAALLLVLTTPAWGNSDFEIPDLEFKPELIEQTKAWAHNAKLKIERGLDAAKRQSTERKESLYRDVLDDVLADSRGENESIMRFILYRAKVVHEVLLTVPRDPKRNATARRLLKEGLERAVAHYQTDISIFEQLERKKEYVRPGQFVQTSLEWIEFILELHYQLPTNSSRLEILKKSLVIWMNDIAKDVTYNRDLAPVTDNAAVFYENISRQNPVTNPAKLQATRDIRTFLAAETQYARRILAERRQALLEQEKEEAERQEAERLAEKYRKDAERRISERDESMSFLTCKSNGDNNQPYDAKADKFIGKTGYGFIHAEACLDHVMKAKKEKKGIVCNWKGRGYAPYMTPENFKIGTDVYGWKALGDCEKMISLVKRGYACNSTEKSTFALFKLSSPGTEILRFSTLEKCAEYSHIL